MLAYWIWFRPLLTYGSVKVAVAAVVVAVVVVLVVDDVPGVDVVGGVG